MNVIEYDGGVIWLTPNLSAYVQNLITISIDNSEYELTHKLIDTLSIINSYKEDTLLDMNKAYYVRVIEEDVWWRTKLEIWLMQKRLFCQ